MSSGTFLANNVIPHLTAQQVQEFVVWVVVRVLDEPSRGSYISNVEVLGILEEVMK